ncbi:hypothetical protein Pla163_00420 [Planctomycetes bacterium Pla163]|uniref:Uncharacterized protein n=1 Tax=Rohdeia mirabilis TaxID=2528008 RepID=A0A518CUP6_9BACT|nr:hypothetical protein Pla163_00420 [Planctomycetes bacterium Pla163]
MAIERRVLGLLTVLLVLAGALFLAFGPNEAADPRALGGSGGSVAEAGGASGEPALADDGAAARNDATVDGIAPSERRAVDGASDSAVSATSDGTRWSDLLRPIDALTLAPIADWQVLLVMRGGELVVQRPDDALDPRRRRDVTLTVLDGPHHAPRPFDLRPVTNTVGGPIDVQLHPTVSVRLELAQHPAQPPFAMRLEVQGIDETLGHGEVVALRDAATRLATAIDATTPNGAREVEASQVYAICSRLGLLGLGSGAEGMLAASRPAEVVASFPHAIVDLPALGSVLIGPRGENYVEFTAPDGTVWTRLGGARVQLPREGSIAIEVRYLGHGSVVGQLPTPFTEGEIATGPWLDVDEWDPNDWSTANESGAFAFEAVLPGEHQLLATWKDAAGVAQRATRNFTIVAGEQIDLGLIAPDAGTTIVLEPVVVVDGEIDRTRLDGALDGAQFRYVLCSDPAFITSLEAMDPQVFSELEESDRLSSPFYQSASLAFDSPTSSVAEGESDGLEPVTLSGLTGTRFGLLVLQTELPTEVAPLFLDPVWTYEPLFDAVGTETRRLELHLTTATRVAITAHVSVPPSTVEQRLWGFVRNHDSGECLVADLEDAAPEDLAAGVPWEAKGVARLTAGTWTVYVFCASGSIDQDSLSARELDFGQVASATVTCAAGDTPEVVLQLAPGAEVVGPPEAFADEGAPPTKWVQVYPTDLGPSAADYWYGFATDDDAGGSTITVSNLLPNTEYRVKDSSRTFRTGPGGSVVELAR